ncbi:MAG: flagellar basal body rod protein FlgC [Deltaproteobacteria bacterium]|nr:flagellar basal body rod protein FlgC [Deltaproteobacteria bacterium]MCX7953141.1 flagellar basal body rod protein FlgC [Deltaproteobacteria bacterium]
MSIHFEIVSRGLKASRTRLEVAASNLANIETTKTQNGEPYREKHVIQQSVPIKKFESELENFSIEAPLITKVVTSEKPPRLVFDPEHPDADERGFVKYPDINPVQIMVDVISASKIYQANVETLRTFSEMSQSIRELLRST